MSGRTRRAEGSFWRTGDTRTSCGKRFLAEQAGVRRVRGWSESLVWDAAQRAGWPWQASSRSVSPAFFKDTARSGQRGSGQIGRGLPTGTELRVARGLVRPPHPVFALFSGWSRIWCLLASCGGCLGALLWHLQRQGHSLCSLTALSLANSLEI